MLALEDVQIVQYLRTLRGGTQPILVAASDGLTYVAKFNNNLQGPNIPLNESAGTELFRACGLGAAAWKPLRISEEFINKNPDCWMRTDEGVLRPASGLCFGSRFLGSPNNKLLEILPGTSLTRIRNRKSFWLAWLVDVCCEHADNRQAVFLQDAQGWLDAHFIDHGHLFGGPTGQLHPHPEASNYLDPRVYPDINSREAGALLHLMHQLDADKLRRRVSTFPSDWKTESAILGFDRCLNRLANVNLLRNVMDALVDTHERRISLGHDRATSEFELGRTLLHARIPPKPTWGDTLKHRWEDCRAAG